MRIGKLWVCSDILHKNDAEFISALVLKAQRKFPPDTLAPPCGGPRLLLFWLYKYYADAYARYVTRR